MKTRTLGLTVLSLALLALASACTGGDDGAESSSGETSGPSPATQTDSAGSVTVEATWITPEHRSGNDEVQAVADDYAIADVVLLHVEMNTHSVDLSGYDLASLATLDAGVGPELPLDWVTISDDQHHTEGVIVFRRPSTAAAVTLTLRDIGGVPARTLRWSPAPS